MITHAYIDASNLFYGGKKSLGWSIDYEKLIKYLRIQFNASQIYYFGGVEIDGFSHDSLTKETVCLVELEKYLVEYIERYKLKYPNNDTAELFRHLKQVRFYKKLEQM